MLNITVMTPQKKVLSKLPIQEATLPTWEGQIQILPGHQSMMGMLETGLFSCKANDGALTKAAVSSGFFHLAGEELTIIAETLELESEINLDRAKKAQLKAEQELLSPQITEEHFKKYQLKLQRALIRQQVAGRLE